LELVDKNKENQGDIDNLLMEAKFAVRQMSDAYMIETGGYK